MPTRYPEFIVCGSPYEMGLQIGEAAREQIRGFAEVAMSRVNLTVGRPLADAHAIARESVPFVQRFAPTLLDELAGMAKSSGVHVDQLMMLQVRNQLLAKPEAGCTSFAVSDLDDASPGTIVGQNWDNDPALDPYTMVLTRRPTDKPPFMTLTQAGLIGYIGVNDRGIAVCMNSLPAPTRPRGVPHYFIVRQLYECDSLQDCIETVSRAERALPANLMMATPQGPADLEITVDEIRVLQNPHEGVVTHSNHCLHPDLMAINQHFPELIESRPRKRRIDTLISQADRPLTVAGLQAILRDHDGYPRSICRHQNDDPATGFWTSVFSVVIESSNARMHVARGNPCQQPFEVYQLGVDEVHHSLEPEP